MGSSHRRLGNRAAAASSHIQPLSRAFNPVPRSDRLRGHGLKMRQGRLSLDMKRNFFTEGVIRLCSDIQEGGVAVLEVFKERLRARHPVPWWCSVTVPLDGPRGLFQLIRFSENLAHPFPSAGKCLGKSSEVLRPLGEGFLLCSRREKCSVCEGAVLCQSPGSGNGAGREMWGVPGNREWEQGLGTAGL